MVTKSTGKKGDESSRPPRQPGMSQILHTRRRLIRAFRSGRGAVDYPPLYLWIESTNRCNLRCPMCPQSSGLKRPPGEMPAGRAESIARQAAGRVQLASLHFAGEPLLHSDLPSLVRIMRDAGVPTIIHSNGILMNRDRAAGLIDAGLRQIVFSFDAVPPEDYPKKRPPATLEKAVAGITSLLVEKKSRRSRRPLVTIKSLLFDVPGSDPSHAAEVRSYFKGLPVDNYCVEYAHSFSGSFAAEKSLDGTIASVDRTGAGFCVMPWYGFSIAWDGEAYLCCNDLNGEQSLGNTDDLGLDGVWNGETMKRIRRLIASGRIDEIPVCSTCTSRSPFDPRGIYIDALKHIFKHAFLPGFMK